jgi:protease I
MCLARWIALAALSFTALTAAAVPMDRPIGPAAAPSHGEEADPVHARLLRFLLESAEDPQELRGVRVAILAADGVDGFDLEVPRRYLQERGAVVHVITPRPAVAGSERVLRAINPSGEETELGFDRFLDEADARAYDAVYLPGHRIQAQALAGATSLAFLQQAVRAGRPLFAIANAPLLLLQAGLLERRRATGDAATFLRLALSNATATDAPLVDDGSIYTSRDAFDLPLLMERMVDELRGRAPR